MYLVRMVYCSRISESFSSEDIDKILDVARKENKKRNVTGLLCFSRKYFLQCLEGGRKAVNETYHNILNDERHEEIVLLDYKEINTRDFTSWQMAYIPEKNITDAINLKFSGTPDFDPFTMHGESAYRMMLQLSKDLTVI